MGRTLGLSSSRKAKRKYGSGRTAPVIRPAEITVMIKAKIADIRRGICQALYAVRQLKSHLERLSL